VTPQAPQLALVLSWVSQSGLLLSQFPAPDTQTGSEHLLSAQVEVALGTAHAWPHFPQCDWFATSEVSQPGSAVQSPNPARQDVILQTPASHVEAPTLARARQSLPQVPQLATSVLRFTQLALHLSGELVLHWPAQEYPEAPRTQSGAAAGQALSQAPQASGRVMAVSQTSSALAVQCR
jgi:hypothetical protein